MTVHSRLALLPLRRPGGGGEAFALDLHLDVRIGLEVQVPLGVFGRSHVGGDHHEGTAVLPVDERLITRVAGLATLGRQDQTVRAVPVVTDRTVGRPVLTDVLLAHQGHVGFRVRRDRFRIGQWMLLGSVVGSVVGFGVLAVGVLAVGLAGPSRIARVGQPSTAARMLFIESNGPGSRTTFMSSPTSKVFGAWNVQAAEPMQSCEIDLDHRVTRHHITAPVSLNLTMSSQS